MCKGGASRILRHNEVRDIVGKAFKDIGYDIGYEHGGGLMDGRKPGDVIVYNWKNRKHLLIDVAVTNPLAVSNHPHLIANGPGNTAKHWEGKKRKKYWDLDKMTYEFRPFIIETTGAFGPSALKLCKLIAKKKNMKCYKGINNHAANRDDMETISHDPLLTSISITVQRNNAHMILERQPIQTRLIESGIERCRQEVARTWKWAKKKLAQVKCGPSHRIIDTQEHNINTTSIKIPRKSPWSPPDGTNHTPDDREQAKAISCCPSQPKENPGHSKDLVPYKKSPAPPPKGKRPPLSSSCSVAHNQKIQNNESGHSRGTKTARALPQIPPHSICSVAHNQKRQNDESGHSKGTKTAQTLPQNQSTTMDTTQPKTNPLGEMLEGSRMDQWPNLADTGGTTTTTPHLLTKE